MLHPRFFFDHSEWKRKFFGQLTFFDNDLGCIASKSPIPIAKASEHFVIVLYKVDALGKLSTPTEDDSSAIGCKLLLDERTSRSIPASLRHLQS